MNDRRIPCNHCNGAGVIVRPNPPRVVHCYTCLGKGWITTKRPDPKRTLQ